jgi:alpha-tubulin suppressor-like RCC1 family protein
LPLTSVGGVKCWGGNFGSTPVDVSGLSSDVTAIAAGARHSCALTSAGGVKCWGANDGGQLGDGTTSSRSTPVDVSGLSSGVTAIAAGQLHSCALTRAGGVKCWGLNDFGQLGDGTTSERLTPVDVSGLSGGVTAIATGDTDSCALTSTGGVKCWGRNDYGQRGNGTIVNRLTPAGVVGFGAAKAALTIVSPSVTVTPARVAALELRCGAQAGCSGTLTLTASVAGKLVASFAARVPVTLGSRTFSIAAGRTHTVKVKLTANGFTLLARAKRLPTQVGAGYRQPVGGVMSAARTITVTAPKGTKSSASATVLATAITAGLVHSCAATRAGGVKCWGENFDGQLGDGTTISRWTPVDVSRLRAGVTAVAAGYGHTCALTSLGGVKCWGTGGELGDGTLNHSWAAVDVLGLSSGETAISPAATTRAR